MAQLYLERRRGPNRAGSSRRIWMDPERWARMLEMLDRATELGAGERAAFLEEACAGDARLRREVESLLANADHLEDAIGETMQMETPDVEFKSPATPSRSSTRIGPYRILKTLGEGGMGTVYLAEQREPIRRRVALKVIRRGAEVRRFEAERQALARMNHPNIAQVFDAGTTEDGEPYLVMEHVPGLPITEYCDGERLGVRRRLELFLTVCEGVQHAHQKGIIHRDIKPSNVLVAEIPH